MTFLSRFRARIWRAGSKGRFTALEELLDYRFRQPDLLSLALTHRSISDLPTENLERLEFLGDAVLSSVISEYLFRSDPHASEGELTQRRSALVNKDFLAEAGEAIGLHNHLVVEGGVKLNDPKVRRNLVGDAMESLIGALYIDGGIKVAKSFITQHVLGRMGDQAELINFKGQLIEVCHQSDLGTPRFQILKTYGPEHDKQFVIQVRIGRRTFRSAEANTKKAAEQAAAELALTALSKSRGRRPS